MVASLFFFNMVLPEDQDGDMGNYMDPSIYRYDREL